MPIVGGYTAIITLQGWQIFSGNRQLILCAELCGKNCKIFTNRSTDFYNSFYTVYEQRTLRQDMNLAHIF